MTTKTAATETMGFKTVERTDIGAFEIRKELEIDAPIEIAFEAVLEELGPEAQSPDGSGKSLSMKFEAWPGGRWYRDLGNNTGHLWGHVQVIKPPTLLEIIGPMPMSYPAMNHVQYRLKAAGGKTLLTFTHQALGLITPEHRDGMPEGWSNWLEEIRKHAERKAKK
jgi:uncharacterized protein YndB with AHSA1/START domain